MLQVHSVGDQQAEAQALVAEAVAIKLSPEASPVQHAPCCLNSA